MQYYYYTNLLILLLLKFKLIKTESNTILKKIYEAFYICIEKPIINDKSVNILHRFLVQGEWRWHIH